MSLIVVAVFPCARPRLRHRVAAHCEGVPVAPGIRAVPIGVLVVTDRTVGLYTYGVV